MSEILRLQKYMSQAWICSRRKAEEYIEKWFVIVNWNKATIWQSIDPLKDKVTMLDNIVEDKKNLVYYKINKPRGIVTTCAEYWDKNIIDIIDIDTRVFPIWRLDKDSEGLILLTNDWRLTNYLIHPRYNHEKEYVVETFWPLSNEQIDRLSKPMIILWELTKSVVVNKLSSWRISIVLTEWKNRQIRRMIEKVWSKVKKLKRIRVENILLWDLNPWEYKKLTKSELDILFSKLNILKD